MDRQRTLDELKKEAIESQLRSEKYELADQLKDVSTSLKHQEEGWTKERNKILKLTFSKYLKTSHLNIGPVANIPSHCR